MMKKLISSSEWISPILKVVVVLEKSIWQTVNFIQSWQKCKAFYSSIHFVRVTINTEIIICVFVAVTSFFFFKLHFVFSLKEHAVSIKLLMGF